MNPYSDFTIRLVAHLQSTLSPLGWTPLDVRKGIWKPGAMEAFERYLVHVAPPLSNPWEEFRFTLKQIGYRMTADIFLLVKNYDEEQSVYGADAPAKGVFQMIGDVKDVLRVTDLEGLVDRTHNELLGPVNFESGAATGFDTGAHGWVHRARLTYKAQMYPFCHE